MSTLRRQFLVRDFRRLIARFDLVVNRVISPIHPIRRLIAKSAKARSIVNRFLITHTSCCCWIFHTACARTAGVNCARTALFQRRAQRFLAQFNPAVTFMTEKSNHDKKYCGINHQSTQPTLKKCKENQKKQPSQELPFPSHVNA
jgi:hypothetical protein